MKGIDAGTARKVKDASATFLIVAVVLFLVIASFV